MRKQTQETILALGDFGFSFGQTIMATLLPVLISRHTESPLLVGAIISVEGACALTVPLVVGRISDRILGPRFGQVGRRTVFLWTGAPLIAITLSITPFLSGIWQYALAALAYFVTLHFYRTPYWSLITDQVPRERWGRVQGVRGGAHSAAIAFSIAGGGALFSIWEALPFLLAAALVLIVTVPILMAGHSLAKKEPNREFLGQTSSPGFMKQLKDRPIRWYLVANSLWTGAVDGIRPYLFLFAAAVLGMGTGEASLLLLALLTAAGIGSVFVGRLSDRYGHLRLIRISAIITTVAMLGGVFMRNTETVLVLFVLAGAGAAGLLAMPYAAFLQLTGDESVGQSTGLYIASDGVGHLLAPVFVGAIIELAQPIFPRYDGYPAMWLGSGFLAFLSILALRVCIKHGGGDRDETQQAA